jgi:ABC-type glycerol-3-phosphate transport system permease component
MGVLGPYKRLKNTLVYIVLTLGTVAVLIPLLWALSTSFKPKPEIFAYPPRLIPLNPTLKNYDTLFFSMPFLKFFINSSLVSLLTVVLTVALGSMAAYPFSRSRFPAKPLLFLFFIGTIMLPALTNIIPLYILMYRIGLINTRACLILLYASGNTAFTMWLLKGFIDGIPRQLDEAAVIDGASRFTIFSRIIFPLITPGVAAAGVVIFINCWNEFIIALTMITETNLRTLTVGIYYFVSYYEIRWGSIMAAAIASIIPVVIFFVFMQKRLITGLTRGALKS